MDEEDCTNGLAPSSREATSHGYDDDEEEVQPVEECEEGEAGLDARAGIRPKAKSQKISPPSWKLGTKYPAFSKGSWKGKGFAGLAKGLGKKGWGKGFAELAKGMALIQQMQTPRFGMRPRFSLRRPTGPKATPLKAADVSTEEKPPPVIVKPPSLRPTLSKAPSLRPPSLRPRAAESALDSTRGPQTAESTSHSSRGPPAADSTSPSSRRPPGAESTPHYTRRPPLHSSSRRPPHSFSRRPPQHAALAPYPSLVTLSIRLSGLPQWWSNRDVEGLCSQHGLVTKIDMPADSGMCLVTFDIHTAAMHAANTINGMKVPGGTSFIRCELFDAAAFESTKKSESGESQAVDLPPHINVFVDELQLATTGEARTEDREVFLRDLPVQDCGEEELKKWLSGFGNTENVTFLVNPDTNKLIGSAYVRFSENSGARAVIDAFPIDSEEGDVRASWSLSERIGQGAEGSLQMDVLGGLISRLKDLRTEINCSSLTLIGECCKGRLGKFSFDVLEGPLRFAWLRKDAVAISESVRGQLARNLQSELAGEKREPVKTEHVGQPANEVEIAVSSQTEDRKRKDSAEEPPEVQPRVLVRGFPASWQEQQLKLVFALFGGTESVTLDTSADGGREAQVQLKDPSQTAKVAERLHNTQVGDGELIETCKIFCEAISGRRRKHRKKDRHAVAPVAGAEQAAMGNPNEHVPGTPGETPAGKGFPPGYAYPPFAPPSWPGAPGYWPYAPHPQYGFPPPGFRPLGSAPKERPDKHGASDKLPIQSSSSSRALAGEQSGVALSEADELLKKQIAKGITLIKKGQSLAAAGVLEEANENYVRGIQRILKMDQSHPLVAAVQKKLARYVDDAEKLQQRLDRAAEPSPVGHIQDDARRHQEVPRQRRRKEIREVRQWGAAEPGTYDERDERSGRYDEPSPLPRRTRVRRNLDRSRSRDQYAHRVGGHSVDDGFDEGLSLKPRVTLVPRQH